MCDGRRRHGSSKGLCYSLKGVRERHADVSIQHYCQLYETSFTQAFDVSCGRKPGKNVCAWRGSGITDVESLNRGCGAPEVGNGRRKRGDISARRELRRISWDCRNYIIQICIRIEDSLLYSNQHHSFDKTYKIHLLKSK